MTNQVEPLANRRLASGARTVAGAPRWRRWLCLAPLFTVLVLAGCGGERGASEHGSGSAAGAAGDTTAFRAAGAAPDAPGKITAFQSFLERYPTSRLRARAYAAIWSLTGESKGPAGAVAFAEQSLKTERDPASRGSLHFLLYRRAIGAGESVEAVVAALKADKNTDEMPFNAIAWDMSERGEDLKAAYELAAMGAPRAKEPGARASVLDTQGWIAFRLGDYENAATLLKQAVDAMPGATDELDEVRGHLGQAYEKAGMKREARDLYLDFLVRGVDSEKKARFVELSQELDGSADAALTRLAEARRAAAVPAADFTLKDYDGKPVSLSDYRGKVVMLNFWHPT